MKSIFSRQPPKPQPKRPSRAATLDLKFPPLPQSVAEIAKLMRDRQRQDSDKLASVVGTDPILAALVLRRVNSAAYGLRTQISDVPKAVSLLGFRDVCNLGISAGYARLDRVIRSPEARRVFGELVQLSMGTALYAQELADHLSLPDRESAFTCGLLHVAGRLVFVFNAPDAFVELCTPGSPTRYPVAAVEVQRFGIDHATLGAQAIRSWKLPEEIASVVGAMEAPGRLPAGPERTLALCVGVAASATSQLCMSGAFDLRFQARTALHVLARLSGRTSAEVIEAIESRQDETIESMAELVAHMSI